MSPKEKPCDGMDVLHRIDKRTEDHTKKLDRIQQSIDANLALIAGHTASLPDISATLSEQKNENTQLVAIIAKRPAVPLVVFLVVVFVLGAVILIEKASITGINFTVAPDKLEIQSPDRQSKR